MWEGAPVDPSSSHVRTTLITYPLEIGLWKHRRKGSAEPNAFLLTHFKRRILERRAGRPWHCLVKRKRTFHQWPSTRTLIGGKLKGEVAESDLIRWLVIDGFSPGVRKSFDCHRVTFAFCYLIYRSWYFCSCSSILLITFIHRPRHRFNLTIFF